MERDATEEVMADRSFGDDVGSPGYSNRGGFGGKRPEYGKYGELT